MLPLPRPLRSSLRCQWLRAQTLRPPPRRHCARHGVQCNAGRVRLCRRAALFFSGHAATSGCGLHGSGGTLGCADRDPTSGAGAGNERWPRALAASRWPLNAGAGRWRCPSDAAAVQPPTSLSLSRVAYDVAIPRELRRPAPSLTLSSRRRGMVLPPSESGLPFPSARCDLWSQAWPVWLHPRVRQPPRPTPTPATQPTHPPNLKEAYRRSNVSQTSLKCRSNVVGRQDQGALDV